MYFHTKLSISFDLHVGGRGVGREEREGGEGGGEGGGRERGGGGEMREGGGGGGEGKQPTGLS